MEEIDSPGPVEPLRPDHLPKLMDITDVEALAYVAQMLQRLVDGHESIASQEHPRRASYESALERAAQSLDRLRPMPDFYAMDAGSADAVPDSHTDASPQAAEQAAKPWAEDNMEDQSISEHGEDDDDQCPENLYKRFWLKEAPPISVLEYLNRFHRYCRSSAATYLTAGRLIYLASVDRDILPVTQLNVYRLFSAAFLIASKFIEDSLYPMSRYATTAGLKKPDLARLELSLLLLIEFDVKVDYETLLCCLRKWAALNESPDFPSAESTA